MKSIVLITLIWCSLWMWI